MYMYLCLPLVRLWSYSRPAFTKTIFIINNQLERIPSVHSCSGGRQGGGLNIPPPVPFTFTSASRPPSVGVSTSLLYFSCKNNVTLYCKIFFLFSQFPPLWKSRFPPSLLPPPVPLPPPILPVSCPPVPLHHVTF